MDGARGVVIACGMGLGLLGRASGHGCRSDRSGVRFVGETRPEESFGVVFVRLGITLELLDKS